MELLVWGLALCCVGVTTRIGELLVFDHMAFVPVVEAFVSFSLVGGLALKGFFTIRI